MADETTPPPTATLGWFETYGDGETRDVEITIPVELADALPPLLPIQILMTLVKRDIGAVAKGRTTDSGATYSFRGIDDVYDAMHEPLAKWGVLPVPRILEIVYNTNEWTEGTRRRAQTVTRLHLQVNFTGPRGDVITADAWAEAQDYGDKAVAKAESVAFRTVMIQQFTIPVHDPVTSVEIEQENVDRAPDGHREAYNELVPALRAIPGWTLNQRGAFVSNVVERDVENLKNLTVAEMLEVKRQINRYNAGELYVRFDDDGNAHFEEEPPSTPDSTEATPEPPGEAAPVEEPEGSGDNAASAPEKTDEELEAEEAAIRAREEIAARHRAEHEAEVEAAAPIVDAAKRQAALDAIADQATADAAGMDKKGLVEALSSWQLSTAGTIAALRARYVDAVVERQGPA